MLSFRKVQKKYNDQLILDIPQLEIKAGLYWLRGINGSGKSTFLKMAGGLIPFDGDIEIDEVNLKKKPTAYRRQVSYAEAEPLYPEFLSGLDLVHFYQSVRKADAKSTHQLIEQLGIATYYKKPIGTYSSGMVKKLSLVLAFIGENKFIFLDEPLVTLDQDSVPVLLKLIESYHQKGTNFIFTSHQSVTRVEWEATSLFLKEKTICFQ